MLLALEGVAASEPVLKTIVTEDMLNTVLSEVLGLVPVLIPVMISFIAIRKGIAFISSILHSA